MHTDCRRRRRTRRRRIFSYSSVFCNSCGCNRPTTCTRSVGLYSDTRVTAENININAFLVRCGPGAEYRKLILETLKLAPYTRTGSRTQDLSRFRLWKSPNRSRAHLLPALELPREPPRRRGRARPTWRRKPRSGRAERHAGTADRRDVLAVDAAASLQAARCRTLLLEHELSPACAQAPAGRAAARRARPPSRALVGPQ